MGARVTGVEISEGQLANAVARDPDGNARYLIGRAEQLPLEDASVDVALFMRSLHHVPIPELTHALAEARRVLRPGGIVYVSEPLAEGDYFELVSLVEDEDEVRAAAQQALGKRPRPACAASTRSSTTSTCGSPTSRCCAGGSSASTPSAPSASRPVRRARRGVRAAR